MRDLRVRYSPPGTEWRRGTVTVFVGAHGDSMLFLAFDTGQVWKAVFVVPSYVYQVVHWNVGQLQLRLPCLQFSPGGRVVAGHQSAHGAGLPCLAVAVRSTQARPLVTGPYLCHKWLRPGSPVRLSSTCKTEEGETKYGGRWSQPREEPPDPLQL